MPSTTRRARLLLGAAAGLLSAAAGVGVAFLVSVLAGGAPTPITAVGGRVIDATPGAVKDWAVRTFGENDKPLLLTGIFTVLALVAAVTGVLTWRSRRLALGVTAGLGVIGLIAAIMDPTSLVNPVVKLLPAVAALIVSVAALIWFISTLGLGVTDLVPGSKARRDDTTTPADDTAALTSASRDVDTSIAEMPKARLKPSRSPASAPAGFDRRQFLVAAMATGAVAAVGIGSSQVIAGAGSRSRDSIALPKAADSAANLTSSLSFDVDGLTPYITPNADFYRVDTALSVPQVDAGSWTLKITGMVDEELEFNFDDILDMELIERRITLACVSNEVGGTYAGNATWLGVRVSDLLEMAGVSSDADAVKSTSVDGMTIGTPLEALTDGREAMLAIGMNGEPLPLEHGFPARLVVPGLYGYVSATKWITEIEVTRFEDFNAYWTDRDFDELAPIKTFSRIDVPKSFAKVTAGTAVVAGVAWAQNTGIDAVEVQVDDGDWQPAKLAVEDNINTWRQWVYEWDAAPGLHQLRVRSSDQSGYTQTSKRVPPRPNGATGWHSVSVTVE